MKFEDLLKELCGHPVIAALCSDKDAEDLYLSNVRAAVIMSGSLATLPALIERVKKSGIHPFIYIDFIDALSAKDAAVDFIIHYTAAEGIVSTKSNQIRRAHASGLLTIQRYFVFDNISQRMIRRQIETSAADCVEILPGVIPGVIQYMTDGLTKPLIVGGFVDTQQAVAQALENGAAAITTSLPGLWYL